MADLVPRPVYSVVSITPTKALICLDFDVETSVWQGTTPSPQSQERLQQGKDSWCFTAES